MKHRLRVHNSIRLAYTRYYEQNLDSLFRNHLQPYRVIYPSVAG